MADCKTTVEVTQPTTTQAEVVLPLQTVSVTQPVVHLVEPAPVAADVEVTQPTTHNVTIGPIGAGAGSSLVPRICQPLLGDIDGVNTVFTTPPTVYFRHETYVREEVHLRGLKRMEGVGCDYVASESGGAGTGYDTITFAKAPKPGDTLSMTYYLA